MKHSKPPKLSESKNIQLLRSNNRPNLQKLLHSKKLQILCQQIYKKTKLQNLLKQLYSKKFQLPCCNNKKTSKVTWVRTQRSLPKKKDQQ